MGDNHDVSVDDVSGAQVVEEVVETVEKVVEAVKEEVEKAEEVVTETVGEVAEKVEKVVEEVKEVVTETVEEVAEKVEEVIEEAKEVVTETVEKVVEEVKGVVTETVEEVIEEAKEVVTETVEEVVEGADNLTLRLMNTEADVQPAAESIVERLAETAYRLVSARLGDTAVGPTTLLTVLRNIMEVVEGSIARGNEQKELAIVLIKRLIRDAGMKESDFALCMAMIDDGIIGNTIDLVVDASKGKLGVNAVKVATSCCLGFLARAQAKRQKRKQEKRRAAELAQ